MWMYRTGGFAARQIILFDYTPGRGAEYPKKFLEGYSGYAMTDGYSAYRVLMKEEGDKPRDVVIVNCWAHARRYYTNIVKGLKKGETIKGTETEKALKYIGKLFHIEKLAKDMSPEKRFEYRKTNAERIVDEYFAWCGSIIDDCAGSLYKAVNYSLNHEAYLRNYLRDGRLDISNNLGENAIRPFCVGRRNWLFSDTPNGAESSAIIYSVIETAKANMVDPFEYMKYIFEVFKDSDIGSLDLNEFMPWSPSLPDQCRIESQTSS